MDELERARVSRRALLKGVGAGAAGLAASGTLIRPAPADAALAEADRCDEHAPLYSGIQTRAAIVLQLDDGDQRDHSVVFPLTKERGLVAASALVSSNLGGGANLTVDQALELQEGGWEILCHSKSHTDNVNSSSTKFRTFKEETAGAKEELEAMGLNVQSFQQPGGWTGNFYFDDPKKLKNKFGDLLRETFAAVFAFTPYDLWNYTRPIPVVHRYGGSLAGGDTMNLTTLKGVVDEAIKRGSLGHLRFHSHNIGSSGFVSVADFTAFLDYLAARMEAGDVDNLTPTAAMFAKRGDGSTNLLGDGSFEDSRAGAFEHWEPTGSPSIETGPGGKYLSGVTQTSHVSQFLRSENQRSLRFEGRARASAGGAATARVIARFADAAGNSVAEVDHTAQVADWTTVTFPMGSHPGARYLRLWLYHTGTGGPIAWDDVRLART